MDNQYKNVFLNIDEDEDEDFLSQLEESVPLQPIIDNTLDVKFISIIYM